MSKEKLGFSPETRTQFTQAGSPSTFLIEEFARSLPDDDLRNMLRGIKPLEQKREQTQKIEEENNIPIELLIFTLYWVYENSVSRVAQKIGIRRNVVQALMERAEIPRRDRLTAVKLTYKDPDRKKDIVMRVHTPESDKKRVKSLTQWYVKHPGEGSRRTLIMRNAKRKKLEQ